jgi:ATP-dependent DNA helicase RecG
MDYNTLQSITSIGEDSRNEDALAAEIVTFSNAKGGIIFIGVSHDGAFKGLIHSEVDRINQLISNAASKHVRSPVSVQTENISVTSDFDHQGVIWLKEIG